MILNWTHPTGSACRLLHILALGEDVEYIVAKWYLIPPCENPAFYTISIWFFDKSSRKITEFLSSIEFISHDDTLMSRDVFQSKSNPIKAFYFLWKSSFNIAILFYFILITLLNIYLFIVIFAHSFSTLFY